jgi:hypothetical protein
VKIWPSTVPGSSSPQARITSRWRPTREGLLWLVVGFLLLYQGWLRTINLVALLASLLLGLWFLNGLMVWRAGRLARLQLRWQTPEDFFAGKPFIARLEVSNPTTTAFSHVTVHSQDPAVPVRGVLDFLPPGAKATAYAQGQIAERGRHVWGPVELTTAYPFGLFRRSVQIQTGESVIVLPRLGQLDLLRFRRFLDGRTDFESRKQPMIRRPGSQTEFHGLREFRSGDSPRWIHWRTSARVGELMVREFEEPPPYRLTVLLDPWLEEPQRQLRQRLAEVRKANRETIRLLLASGPRPTPEQRRAKEASLARKEIPLRKPLEDFETAVSLAATLCFEWNRLTGSQVALAVLGQNEPPLVSDGSNEMLALVEGGPYLPNMNGVASRAGYVPEPAWDPLGSGPILVITTRQTPMPWLAFSQARPPVVLDVSEGSHSEFFRTEEMLQDGASREWLLESGDTRRPGWRS